MHRGGGARVVAQDVDIQMDYFKIELNDTITKIGRAGMHRLGKHTCQTLGADARGCRGPSHTQPAGRRAHGGKEQHHGVGEGLKRGFR